MIAAAAFAVGYLVNSKPAAAAPPAANAPSAVRGIGLAQYGNCQCANGSMCVGQGNCACCDKQGGTRVRLIITGKPAMQLQRKVSGYSYGGGLA